MRIVLSLGSNMGDRFALLAQAVAQIRTIPDTSVVSSSSIYISEPWGKTDQPCFANQTVIVETTQEPLAFLHQTQRIEIELGRVRHERWGPRTLDIDLIAADSRQYHDRELTLPHPYAHQRAFVLAPWLELEPAAELPGFGPIADLVANLTAQDPHAVRQMTATELAECAGAQRWKKGEPDGN
ncbi:MAG: 2-amino-4-hydroxy-6-hydroxymethyldihydropteridine diphosphokinase [Propionibacteriaceae bacterium]